MGEGWNNFWTDFGNIFGGKEQQVGQDYTTNQQALQDTAYGNAALALQGFIPQQQGFTEYQNYMNSLDPNAVFNAATSDASKANYQSTVNDMMSENGVAMRDLARMQGDAAANQAAERFNLSGPGGLFSGGAAAGIAQGAAAPMYQANVDFANMRSGAYQNLFGQNMNSLQNMYGLQAQGLGNVAQLGAGQDAMGFNQASALANLFGNQGANYDTAAMFQHQPGLFDYATALIGGTTAYGDISQADLGNLGGVNFSGNGVTSSSTFTSA